MTSFFTPRIPLNLPIPNIQTPLFESQPNASNLQSKFSQKLQLTQSTPKNHTPEPPGFPRPKSHDSFPRITVEPFEFQIEKLNLESPKTLLIKDFKIFRLKQAVIVCFQSNKNIRLEPVSTKRVGRSLERNKGFDSGKCFCVFQCFSFMYLPPHPFPIG